MHLIEPIGRLPRHGLLASGRMVLNAGRDWRFARLEGGMADEPSAVFLRGETVTLPHTPRIEKAHVTFPFQGVCWYGKAFRRPEGWEGRRVVLRFGAAMHIAEVFVDGEPRLRHLGGYLPFGIDLTEDFAAAEEVRVAVRLDNRDTQVCPPGKPLEGLDFSYFGGLYREAELHLLPRVHVTDPVEAGIEAGGGVFVRCEDASAEKATLRVKVHVANHGDEIVRRATVHCTVVDPSGREAARASSLPVMINARGDHAFRLEIPVERPGLWHPDHPRLHVLRIRVALQGDPVDEMEIRFGIRHLRLGKRFEINGRELEIRGTNRHQEYPHLGNALSRAAHRRDARKIKEAGFNYVRLSHYPQDPAFLDACDELGLLVQAAIPGWQQFWMNPSFVATTFQNIRDLVRRDRNHPSIVFWEPNLNETEGDQSDWCRAAHEITHAELPGTQCFTFGDPYPPKPGWEWDAPGMWREYGDFNFGGNESTSRHVRADGDAGMLQQAWNFLWTLNHLNGKFREPETVYYGCATWVMFDYNRGYYPKPCTSGMMDIFRLPKYVYHFYRSQRDAGAPGPGAGPMTFVANSWQAQPERTKVVVFSNCEEVALLVNGREVARRRPDAGPDTEYSDWKPANLATVGNDFDTSGGNPFDGGNCRNLPHPPFTFPDVPYAPGEVVAIGYLGGREACRHAARTPGVPARLALGVDLDGAPLTAGEADSVFVRVRVLDAAGTLAVQADPLIRLELEGDGLLIGENPVRAEAGIATVLLQAGNRPGSLRLRASAEGLGTAEATANAEPSARPAA